MTKIVEAAFDIRFQQPWGSVLSQQHFINAVFTDHKVPVYRQVCGKCKWSSVPSISSLFGTHMHPDLIKLQCEEVSKQSYPKARESLNRQSLKKRAVNSMMTLHGVVESVANYIGNDTAIPVVTKACADLIVQVDGGHLSSKEDALRSFEALTAIVYQPGNVILIKIKHEVKSVKNIVPPRHWMMPNQKLNS